MEQPRNSLEMIYDIPTRIFHWIFVCLFVTAIVITKTLDDESPLFVIHMLIGLTLSFLVILRVLWGIFGSKHARFAQMPLNPRHLIKYFSSLLRGSHQHWSGHNPASSWSGIVLMALAIGLGITGYLMTGTGAKEDFEDIHEIFANGFIVVSLLHLAGLVLHTWRNKDGILMSMVHGKKESGETPDAIESSHPILGLVLVVLLSSFGLLLWKNFDSTTNTLRIWGQNLQLGEYTSESESESANSIESEENSENED